MAHGSSSSSGNPYNNSYGRGANDNSPGGSRPAANDNRSSRPSSSPVATTKVGVAAPVFTPPAGSGAAAEFFASRANSNFSRGGITGMPDLSALSAAVVASPTALAVGQGGSRVASSKLRNSKLRLAVPQSVAVSKLVSPAVRSPSVRASAVVSAPRVGAVKAPKASVTSNAPAFKGYDATSGERSKAAESRDVRCKPRPKDNRPKGGGGGGKRKFVPWC